MRTSTEETTTEERIDLVETELERHALVIEKLDRLVYKLFEQQKRHYVSKAQARRILSPDPSERE